MPILISKHTGKSNKENVGMLLLNNTFKNSDYKIRPRTPGGLDQLSSISMQYI